MEISANSYKGCKKFAKIWFKGCKNFFQTLIKGLKYSSDSIVKDCWIYLVLICSSSTMVLYLNVSRGQTGCSQIYIFPYYRGQLIRKAKGVPFCPVVEFFSLVCVESTAEKFQSARFLFINSESKWKNDMQENVSLKLFWSSLPFLIEIFIQNF